MQIEILVALSPVVLTAMIAGFLSFSKRMNRIERTLLMIIVMLRDRGLAIPDVDDPERLIKSKSF
ncbi:MAG: hypothetical protein ACRED1_06360 [Limisphaerales bacterium]